MEPRPEFVGRERLSLRQRMLSIDGLRNIPVPTPLVQDLLHLDSLAIFYGPPGCGKSFLATELSACVATGTPWHQRPVRQSPALNVLAEGISGQAQRYGAWLEERGVAEPSERQLLVLPESVNLLSPSSVGAFADEACEFGAKLIVLDTLARCMVGGDESSAKDAGLAVEQLDVIRRRTGACVAAIHHTGKDAKAGARGSSAFEAAADSVFRMSINDGVMAIQCTKQKHHSLSEIVRLRMRSAHGSVVLDEQEGWASDGLHDGERRILQKLQEVSRGAAVASKELTGSTAGSTFYRHLNRLVTLGMASKVIVDTQPRYQITELGALTLSANSHGSA